MQKTYSQACIKEYSSIEFDGGPRARIGKNIALLEVTKPIPELFRRFKMEFVDPKRYGYSSGWLVHQHSLHVRFKLRDQREFRA